MEDQNGSVNQQAPVTGTQVDGQTTTPVPASEGQHVVSATEEQHATPAPVQVQPPALSPEEYTRLQGKVSAVEKEKAKLAKEFESSKKILAYYNEDLRDNKEAFDKFAKRYEKDTGQKITYEQVYGAGQSQQAGVIDSTANKLVASEDITQQIRDTARQEVFIAKENNDAIEYFQKELPEMAINPEDTPEIKAEKEKKFDEIIQLMPAAVPLFKQRGYSLGQTLVHLFKTLPENFDKTQAENREQGEIAGRQNVIKSGMGVTGGISSGGTSTLAPQVNLSRLTGAQKEWYEEKLKVDPASAYRYYQNATREGPISGRK